MKDEVRFTLRIPKPLYDRASALASGSFMSLNGYVLSALKEWVEYDEADQGFYSTGQFYTHEESERIRKSVERVMASNTVSESLSSPKPIPQNTIEKEEK